MTTALGSFRMPAEWEAHEATWITWPHKQSDWPGKLAPIPWVYAEIVRKLAQGELVRIVVAGKKQEDEARKTLKRAGVDPKRVEYFRFPTDRGWNRDMGPIFVRSDARRGDLQVARFRFSAWAKYPDWKKDDQVPDRERIGADLNMDSGGNRRTLRLANPGLPFGTTPTFWCSIQYILPGEIGAAHRHAANAWRYIIQGDGAKSAVDGEQYHFVEATSFSPRHGRGTTIFMRARSR